MAEPRPADWSNRATGWNADEMPAAPVDDDTIERFRDDGAVVLRNAVAGQWLELLAEGVEYNRRHPSEWSHWYTDPDEAVGFWSDYVTWPRVEQYRRVVHDSGLAAVAGALMQSSSVRFFHEHVLVKEPGAAEATPWHHDDPYYGIDGLQNVSMWIALDSVPASTGLQFIAGSHRSGRRFVPRRFTDQTPYGEADDRFELLPPTDELLAGERVIGWDVEPGDVVAFHFRTLHGAPGNHLTSPRRAVSLRWLGDDARFGVRPWVTSPPFEPDGLVEGGELGDDPRFPLIVVN
jgi:hypothetical protein